MKSVVMDPSSVGTIDKVKVYLNRGFAFVMPIHATKILGVCPIVCLTNETNGETVSVKITIESHDTSGSGFEQFITKPIEPHLRKMHVDLQEFHELNWHIRPGAQLNVYGELLMPYTSAPLVGLQILYE